MANAIIRAGVFRVGSRKVADVHGITFAVDSNNKATFGADGYLGHTDGSGMCKWSIDQIIPVAGADVDIMGIIIGKTRVTLQFFAGGKNYQCANAVGMSGSFKSETEDGSLDASHEFESGLPTVIG